MQPFFPVTAAKTDLVTRANSVLCHSQGLFSCLEGSRLGYRFVSWLGSEAIASPEDILRSHRYFWKEKGSF